jgi:hypothetical protein
MLQSLNEGTGSALRRRDEEGAMRYASVIHYERGRLRLVMRQGRDTDDFEKTYMLDFLRYMTQMHVLPGACRTLDLKRFAVEHIKSKQRLYKQKINS